MTTARFKAHTNCIGPAGTIKKWKRACGSGAC